MSSAAQEAQQAKRARGALGPEQDTREALLPSARVPCTQCGLPTRAASLAGGKSDRGPLEQAFCCVGCSLAWHFGAGSAAGAGGEREEEGTRLEPRLLLSAFLSMGVMVFSLALYGEQLADQEVVEAARLEGGEAVHALRGLLRGAALLLSTPVLHLLGGPLLLAVLRSRRWLSADSLVLLAAVTAYGVSVWNTLSGEGHVYFETSTMVLVLVTTGRLLDGRSRTRARRALTALAPDTIKPAVRLLEGGGEEQATPAELRVGDRVRVRAGEVVPVDGVVSHGRAFVDGSELTGEEEPLAAVPGTRVLAGMRPTDGCLELVAEAVGAERVQEVTRSLLAEALGRRGRTARLADRAAGSFLPLVLLVCAWTLWSRSQIVGPGAAWMDGLSVLLIACPCALGIATPLAFWTALGAAWQRGILVRGGDVLERLAAARRVLFDKTGTLTSGELELVHVESLGLPEPDARRLAAALETGSEHPIGRALRRGSDPAALPRVEDFEVLPGEGVRGRIGGTLHALRRAAPRDSDARLEAATIVQLERHEGGEPQVLARFALEARPRPEAAAVIEALRGEGLELEVLTGDSDAAARSLGRELNVPVQAQLLPGDKLGEVARLGRGTIFVGDGLNDVAALAAADAGIAVRHASPASLRAAGASLLGAELDQLPTLLRLARRARAVARLNLVWAFGYNIIGLWLASQGRLTPIFAASAMVVSSALVVLHSRRAAGGLDEPPPGAAAPRPGAAPRRDLSGEAAAAGPV